MKPPRMGLAVLSASILLALSCQNPAFLGKIVGPETGVGQISIELTGLSPIFEDLFMAAPGANTRSVSSRAFIGATRVEFRLFDITDPELETSVDSWSLSIADMNSSSGSDTIRTASHSVPSSVNLNGTVFRLEVDIFNSSASVTEPVVTGSKSNLTITPDTNNWVLITCVPASLVDLVSGSPQAVATAPFVLVDSMVTAVGGEAWYRIVVTGKRLALTCTVDALNTSTVAGVLYKQDGTVASGRVKFSASASQPYSKIFTLSTDAPGTPVTYYLGVAQSRQFGAGSNFGFTISATDGPADPLAPTLTPGPGTVTVTWQSDPSVGSYSLFYGQPLAWLPDYYQGGITELANISAIEGELSQTITLPPEQTYGFWLEWSKDGISATGQFVWDLNSHGTSGVGNPATAAALHVTSTVNTDWTCEAIGPIPDGSAGYDAGTGSYTLTGAGVLGLDAVTWLQFLHQPKTGDFTIQLRVTSIGDNGDTSEWRSFAQAGIAVRSNLTPESLEMLHGVEFGASYTGSGDPIVWTAVPQQSISLTYPQTGEGNNKTISSYAVPAPVWLKATRVGTLIEAWYSIDDCSTWIEVNPYGGYDYDLYEPIWLDMTMDGPVELGMYVIGNNGDSQVTAVFDNVTISTP